MLLLLPFYNLSTSEYNGIDMTFVRKEQKTLPPLLSSMLSSHNRPCSLSYRQPFMVMAATLQMHDCRREGTVLSGICKLLI